MMGIPKPVFFVALILFIVASCWCDSSEGPGGSSGYHRRRASASESYHRRRASASGYHRRRASSSGSSRGDGSLSAAAIAGIVIGGIALVASIVTLVLLVTYCSRKNSDSGKKKGAVLSQDFSPTTKGPLPDDAISSGWPQEGSYGEKPPLYDEHANPSYNGVNPPPYSNPTADSK